MADAFIISRGNFTAGTLASQRKGFRFDAFHPTLAALQDRVFESPSAARLAVEKLIAGKLADLGDQAKVECRALW